MRETTKSAAQNRLRFEKSPYLLQHAENPINWFPWCPEAFETARREDKPIFLSVGYSTCYWCHVMGRESFEDLKVAQALNDHFISIKVDREERPDVDGVYMAACQALTGSGGWPLTILMTPEQEPFWAGTYLPPRGRNGGLGLLELADEVSRLWRSDRRRLLELGQRSGAGDASMEKIARDLSEEGEAALDALVSRVEPALVLVCSVLVGLILLSVMLPLMHIMSAIG